MACFTLHRLFAAMALVPIHRQLLAREYEYRMDGVRAGTLFVLDGPTHARKLSWHSAYTGFQTPWQGGWFSPTGDIERSLSGNFDYEGRREKALFKWFRVEWFEDGRLKGRDYKGRLIDILHVKTYSGSGQGWS